MSEFDAAAVKKSAQSHAMLKKQAEAAALTPNVTWNFSAVEKLLDEKNTSFLGSRPLTPCLILADVIPDYLMKFPKIGNPFDTGMLDPKPTYIPADAGGSQSNSIAWTSDKILSLFSNSAAH